METKHVTLALIIIIYVLIVYYFSKIGNQREIGHKRLFWISLFLTPVIGLAFFMSSQHRKIRLYTEIRYKCTNCGYVFSEKHSYCPICEKEGKQHKLEQVDMYMT